MKVPRWMHKLYARFFCYFWLPCPICGECFGGHEVNLEQQGVYMDDGSCRCICSKPECNIEAIKRNLENGKFVCIRDMQNLWLAKRELERELIWKNANVNNYSFLPYKHKDS